MKGTKAVPLPPNSQAEAELYNSENEKAIEGQTEAQTKLAIEINKDLEERYERKRRYDAEKAQDESNERDIEYNSQRELDDLEDDLDQSEPDYNDNDTYLQDDEFGGNYFEKPVENEEKSSLGDRVRAKYDSLSEKISSSAGSFLSGFNQKMDSFERGDPLFNTKRPATKKRSIRYVSRTRQNKNLSRPYVGGRFNDDSFTNAGYNPYYPVVNASRQSSSSDEPRDLYLPSGGTNPYTGEFSGRTAFKQSEFSDERERYDPFGFGGLSGDGFNNTSGFGSSLMGFGGDNGIFGGSAGHDNVFGNFGGGKTGKMDILGNSGMFAIGDLVIPQASRKTTTTKRKSTTRKTAKKATKKPATKRKPTTRKQAYKGFALP